MAILKAPSNPPKNGVRPVDNAREAVGFHSLRPFPLAIPFRHSLQEQRSAIHLTIHV